MAAHAPRVPRDHPHAPSRIIRPLERRQRSDPGRPRNAIKRRRAVLNVRMLW